MDVRSERNVKSLLHLVYSRSFSRYVIIVINKTTQIVKDKVTAIEFHHIPSPNQKKKSPDLKFAVNCTNSFCCPVII